MNKVEQKVLETIKFKAKLKHEIFENTKEVFLLLKKTLLSLVDEYNQELSQFDERFLLEYRDKAEFEVELKVAGDLLIFNMHTNVFQFHGENNIWRTSYVSDNEANSFVGIINVYNFLADSIKYQRNNDVGYLIGRLFVNQEKHYFLEGKHQLGFLYNDFQNAVIDEENMRNVLNSCILYTINFDLFVPHYDNIKVLSVNEMIEKINISKMKTGKRLGFKYNADNDESTSDE